MLFSVDYFLTLPQIGGDANILGLPIHTALSFFVVWLIKVGLFFGEIKDNVATGGVFTAIIGVLILPWKIINNLFLFYSFIGSMFGPIAGIMLSDFYLKKKHKFDLNTIYGDENQILDYNKQAIVVLIISFSLSMMGAFFPGVTVLKLLNDFAFFSGLFSSFILYSLLSMTNLFNNKRRV